MSEAINEYEQEDMMSEQPVPQKPKPKRPARPRKKPAPAVSLDSIEAIMASVYDMDRSGERRSVPIQREAFHRSGALARGLRRPHQRQVKHRGGWFGDEVSI